MFGIGPMLERMNKYLSTPDPLATHQNYTVKKINSEGSDPCNEGSEEVVEENNLTYITVGAQRTDQRVLVLTLKFLASKKHFPKLF